MGTPLPHYQQCWVTSGCLLWRTRGTQRRGNGGRVGRQGFQRGWARSWPSARGLQDCLDRELESGKQPRPVSGGWANGVLDPLAARPPQHLHQSFVRIDDPVLDHTQSQVFLGLLLVVAMPRAGRNDLDDDLRDPLRPDLIVVLPLRRRRLVDGQIRMPLRFQTGDQQLALASPGSGVDELGMLTLEIRELLAECVEQLQMARLGYVDHGYDSPAQFVETLSFRFRVLEFLEAHSSPLIGWTDSGAGLAAHGLLSTGPDGDLRDTSRGIDRLAGARQTLSSQGWYFSLSIRVVFPARMSRDRVTRTGMSTLPS